jgi:hypothetical protein
LPKGVIIYHKIKYEAMNLNTTTKLSTEQETTPFGNLLLPAGAVYLAGF